MTPIETHQRYPKLTVGQVLRVLQDTYAAGHKQFYAEFMRGCPQYTVESALETWPESCLRLRLGWSLGPIRFYGGPPKNSRWYFGSISTMLFDMVLYNAVTNRRVQCPPLLPFIEHPAEWQIT